MSNGFEIFIIKVVFTIVGLLIGFSIMLYIANRDDGKTDREKRQKRINRLREKNRKK